MRNLTILGLVASLAIVASPARAGFVLQHQGATDPTAEGWVLKLTASINGPVVNDLGTGLDAWAIGKANGTDDGLFYDRNLTLAQTAEAQALGWRLSANIRLVDIVSSTGQAPVAFAYFVRSSPTSQTIFNAELSTQADGDPIVKILTTNPNTPIILNLDGLGAGYHLYEFVFDPATMQADFLVDGVERQSDIAGALIQAPVDLVGGRLAWGIPSPTSVGGQGNYNLVRFEAVPEPASAALVGLGALVLLGSVRRQARKPSAS